MFVEVDTDVQGLAEILAGLTRTNLYDLQQSPELLDELVRRAGSPAGFKYRPERVDRWSAFRVLSQRHAAGHEVTSPIACDCEDLTAACAALAELMAPGTVEVCITQPHGDGLAHAYFAVRGTYRDPSVAFGMKPPPKTFYGAPETGRVRIS